MKWNNILQSDSGEAGDAGHVESFGDELTKGLQDTSGIGGGYEQVP